MADPLVRLDTQHAFIQHGGQARFTVTITNPGTVVEGYQLQVLGAAAPWAEIVPPEVSVYPQQEVTAAVVFSPASGPGAPGGLQPFGVLARSTLDPQVSAVAEGDVEIGQVFGLAAKLTPVTSSGRWQGRHVLQVTNTGNAPADLRFVASDPDAALGYYLAPEIVSVPVGGQATVRMSVRTKRPFLRGTPVRLPFQVVGERLDATAAPPPSAATTYGDPARPVVDGAMTQKPILSRTFVTLVALALAGIVGLAGYLVFRPDTEQEALADRGTPPRPGLVATPTSPETIALTWPDPPIGLVEKYTLVHLDPNGLITKTESLDQVATHTDAGLTPATDYCYQLSATFGGLTGPLSQVVCARTPDPVAPSPTASPTPTPSPSPSASPVDSATPPPASPSPTPTSTVVPGDPLTDPVMNQKWIAVIERLPLSTTTEDDARGAVLSLTTLGVAADYRNSATYPELILEGTSPTPVEPSYLVFEGPFDTSEEVTARCAAIVEATGITPCTAAQPDPL